MSTVAPAAPYTPPGRSPEQRFAALELANHVRTWRADFKARLASKRKADALDELIDELQDPAPELATAKAIDLLLSIRTIGRHKANRLLSKARMSPSKTIGGMSDRQRNELAGLLRVLANNRPI